MRKVAPLKFQFKFVDGRESKIKIKRVYKNIFDIARQNILKRRKTNTKGGEYYDQRRNDKYVS
jgi:hypothetical protein